VNEHARYLQQASWTRELRAYLFEKAGTENARRALEVGCGTGAILADVRSPASLFGLDIDLKALAECKIRAPKAALTRGDAHTLPYPAETFDIVYCHFLLLWIAQPLKVVSELKRVARRGGSIIAFAEPDYANRVDKPETLAQIGRRQIESLKRRGADPTFGARLAETFHRAGIKLVETGPIEKSGMNRPDEWEQEWAMIESDLAESVPVEEIQKMKLMDGEAWARGERVLYVPTYFAFGRVL
jgi:ubiquinone/menaquinone biosynthesis C-methylase UbiE